ncbi:hypothetical protein G3M48_002880 [Beauveria asiatica]|uniref:Uncharacterized protein n=1 Tax=Beauveria asiatica TaxID=1069075 RepID=A0AAW0S7Z1_9HYPO
MKSPIILATLFAGSLAAVPLPLPGICDPNLLNCALVDTAIREARTVAWPFLPKCIHTEAAIKDAIEAFNYKIGCGQPPPEPEAPPADEQCDCKELNAAIEKGEGVLRLFIGCYKGYCEAVKEAIRVFKKRAGCKKEAGDMARDIEVTCRAA